MATIETRLSTIRTWWRKLTGHIWRYDFFISYHWDSGSHYAVNLAQRLRSRKFDCFLDRTDFAAGDVWVDEGRFALLNAQTLILVGTEKAITHSEPVRIELELFTKRNQRIIPICFGKPIAEIVDIECSTMKLIPSETIWIIEDEANLSASPSQRVIDEIVRSSKLLTSRRLRTLIVGTVIIVLSVALALASLFAVLADNSAREAQRQAEIQLARRLTSEATRIADDRKQVAVLLASHGLGIMKRHGESHPTGQRLLRRLLPEELLQRLPRAEALYRPVESVVDKKEMVRVIPSSWHVRRNRDDPLMFHIRLGERDKSHTIRLTRDHGVNLDPGGLVTFTFSNDSKWLVTEGINVQSELWNLKGVSVTSVVLPIETLLITESNISPNSRWLASYGQYAGVSLWNLTSSDPTANSINLKDHSELTTYVAFSPDSSLLATGSSDNTVRVYRIARGGVRNLFVLRHHTADIGEVVFGPSGRWLVTRDSSRSTVLWDLQSPSVQSTGIQIDTTSPENAKLFFLEDRLFLERVSKGEFKTIILDTNALLQKAAMFVGRNLSHSEWDEFFPDMFYQRTFVKHPEGEEHPEPEEIF